MSDLENKEIDLSAKILDLAKNIKPLEQFDKSVLNSFGSVKDEFSFQFFEFSEKNDHWSFGTRKIIVDSLEKVKQWREKLNDILEQLKNSLDPIIKKNELIHNRNLETIKSIIEICDSCNLPKKDKVEVKTRSRYKKYDYVTSKWLAGFVEIKNSFACPAKDALWKATAKKDSYLKAIDLIEKSIVENNKLLENEIKEQEKLNEAILYAKNNNVDISGLTKKDILRAVLDHKIEEYRKENLPDGKIIHIDCCDDCSEYTIGERRCSCGNVRVDIVVEEGHGGKIWHYDSRY